MKKIVLLILTVFIVECAHGAPIELKELFRIKYKKQNEIAYSGRLFSLSKDYISLVMPNKYALYSLEGKKIWESTGAKKVYGEMSGNGLWHILEFQKRNDNEYFDYIYFLNKEGKVVWKKQIDASPSISWDGERILLQKQAETEYGGSILIDASGEEIPTNKELLKNEQFTYLTNTGNLLVLSSLPGKGGNIRKVIYSSNEQILREYMIKGGQGYDYQDAQFVFTNSPDDYYIAVFQDNSQALDGGVIYRINSFNNGELMWESDKYGLDLGDIFYTASLSDGGKFFSFFDKKTSSVIYMDNIRGNVLWGKKINEFGNESVSHIKVSARGKYILVVGNKDMLVFNNLGQNIYQGKRTKNIINIALSEGDTRLYMADDTTFYAYDISGILK